MTDSPLWLWLAYLVDLPELLDAFCFRKGHKCRVLISVSHHHEDCLQVCPLCFAVSSAAL